MKGILITSLLIGIAVSPLSAAENAELKTSEQKASYLFGFDIGGNMNRQGIEVDSDAFLLGLNAALAGKTNAIPPAEIQAIMVEFRQKVMAKREKAQQALASDGEKFLMANKKKEGVKVTQSGLQYKVIKSGSGKSPKIDSKVTTHYRGTLIDGTEFDSSYSRGQPSTFGVNQVIKGWTEALLKMKEGDKWQLFIPAELAYGRRGQGQKIPPMATLIFEIELIKVN
ncbi:MAG: hypothetical protein CMO80_15125 [Verrucomicrobiales bacterium]|nr:hypothetical protein [Verrucomicrobiales bacterium]|tara:strand:- start:4349 stop:5026 length:678 start_codon:yes stop_codon:yes gene_type:complete